MRGYPIAQVFLRDCQQTSVHWSDRNASWMSARLSYRTKQAAERIPPTPRYYFSISLQIASVNSVVEA